MNDLEKLINEILNSDSPTRIIEIKEDVTDLLLAESIEIDELKILKLWQEAVDARNEKPNLEIPGSIKDVNEIFKIKRKPNDEKVEFQKAESWLKNNGNLSRSLIEDTKTHEVKIKVVFTPNRTNDTVEEIGDDYVKIIIDLYRSEG